MLSNLDIKLEAARQAIAVPNFKRDDLLRVALVDLSTLQLPVVLEENRLAIEHQFRRLALLGDRLLDAVLIDYLFATRPELSNQDLDHWRKEITGRASLTKFAIALGLPDYCSSWNKPNRKPPTEEPGVYGEMFEALVGVIYLDGERNFERVYKWLRDRYIYAAVNNARFREEI
jgi:dsRNA-specific ribonuclease